MPSFDGEKFTYTRENAAEQDKEHLPDLAALSAGAMTSSSGLNGLEGVETSLIKGDRNEYLKGNQTTEREKNLKDITQQNSTWYGKLNHDQQIGLSSTLQIGKDRWKTIKGETLEHYTGEVSIVYSSNLEVEQPMKIFEHVNTYVGYGMAHSDNFILYSLAAVAAVSAFVGNLDVRGGNYLLAVAVGESILFKHEEKAEELSMVMMRQSVRLTEAFAIGIEPGVGAAMFHEVAITQEIIAVGVNQWV